MVKKFLPGHNLKNLKFKKFGFLRLLLTILCLFCITNTLWANDLASKQIENILKTDPLSNKAQISISVRNAQNSQVIYEKDSKLLLHPASTLKAFVSAMALDYLNPDYEFETAFYKKDETYYLKLCGDPLMDEKILAILVSQLRLKEEKVIKNLIIDDSAIDSKSWGTGWMWDDNTNPYMPQISVFNLNHNLINLKITPQKNQKILIETFPNYPLQIISQLKNSNKTNIQIERKIFTNPDIIMLNGEVCAPTNILIPILNPTNYFVYMLEQTFNMYGIIFNPDIKIGKTPFMAQKITFVKHNIKEIINCMNKQSDNLAAEVILKHAGTKYTNKAGATEDGLEVFAKYYKDLGIDNSDFYLVDGSGASHNDLITTDWMTFALSKIFKTKYFDIYLNSLAVPFEEGTLKDRLPELKDNLHAKTGTNAGISGLTGYLTTKSGQKVCFAILIQNFKGNSTEAKNLENKIVISINNI